MIDPVNRFTTKAERYVLYRWEYAPEAIKEIFNITGLTSIACVADIGSGTGLLTEHLIGKVKTVYSIEPNHAMRQIAERLLNQYPSYISLDGKAEATLLPDNSVDLITVDQALHWFVPHAALKEFNRILKPDGWLAILSHTTIQQEVSEALKKCFTEEYGWDPRSSPEPFYGESHEDYYLIPGECRKMHFHQAWQENWDMFIGGILSDSHAPEDSNTAFPKFVKAIRQIFDQYSRDDFIQVDGGTELTVGHLREDVI